MIKYNSFLKLSNYNKSQMLLLCEKIKLLGEKQKITFNLIKVFKKISNFNTILKSPHVNKKARDQISIDNCYAIFKFENNKKIYNFINLLLQNDSYKANLRFVFNETVFFVFKFKRKFAVKRLKLKLKQNKKKVIVKTESVYKPHINITSRFLFTSLI